MRGSGSSPQEPGAQRPHGLDLGQASSSRVWGVLPLSVSWLKLLKSTKERKGPRPLSVIKLQTLGASSQGWPPARTA